ncbi:MAG: hypothetical protein HFH72_08980 [Lachnospiraceae bacterium]|nr:hypothetical protein [Lachnospiraceae bacterium]
MDNLIVKPVDVLGSSIMAAQDEKGRIFAGVNYFCNALGMTKGQRDKQVQKVQKDEVLKQGCFRLEAGVFDPSNEAITLRIEFIPLWLAKIVITDKTKQENPELADKLLEYQLKAKDILAEAFLPQQENGGDVRGQIKLLAQGTDELYQRVEGVEERIKGLEDTMNIDHGQQRKLANAVNRTVITVLGGKESNAYKTIGRKVFCECNGNLKDYFKVNSRDDVPRKRYEEALSYAEKWKPCMNTQMLIEQYNAQQTLDLEGGAYHG